MRLSAVEACDLARRAFAGAGVPAKEADDAAEILTLAEMMSIGTHGLMRVADYVGRIGAGGIEACAVPEVTAAAPALRLVDGHHGLGPAVAKAALDAAMAAARNEGTGAAFVRHGSHIAVNPGGKVPTESVG